MSSTLIADILKKLMYNKKHITPVLFKGGPTKAQHRKVINGSSKTTDVPYIVPNDTFKPEVMVCFDFTYQYTSGSTESIDNIEPTRPVSAKTFEGTVKRLLKYYSYYYDYASTPYSKTTKLSDFIGSSDGTQESKYSYAANKIINDYTSSIQISKTVNQIGTCSIVLNENRNFSKTGKKNLLFMNNEYGIFNQLFVPMVPVMVWAKGRMYSDWWFPIYDGFITNIDPSETNGFAQITINCRDSLEIARFSQEMVNPSVIQLGEIIKQTGLNIFAQPFYGLDHLQIFEAMFKGGKLVYDPNSNKRMLSRDPVFEKGSEVNFTALGNYVLANDYDETTLDPREVADTVGPIHKDRMSLSKVIKETSHEARPRIVSTWGTSLTPYRLTQFTTPQTFTAEFSSRLEILNNIAQSVYYNFYVDGYGTTHYHPMRVSNEYLTHDIILGKSKIEKHKDPFPGVQVIGPEETISRNNRVNIEELVTFLSFAGKPAYIQGGNPDILGLRGISFDRELMARFGYRRKYVTNDLVNIGVEIPGRNGRKAFYVDLMAQALMDYMNSELHATQVSMVFRPELQLAKPIYYPDDEEIFYAQSVDHSITINGEATTSVSGNFGRKEQKVPPDLQSFILISEDIYKSDGQLSASPPSLELIIRSGIDDPIKEYNKALDIYYNQYFAINAAPILDWIDEIHELRKSFNTMEEEKIYTGSDLA